MLYVFFDVFCRQMIRLEEAVGQRNSRPTFLPSASIAKVGHVPSFASPGSSLKDEVA